MRLLSTMKTLVSLALSLAFASIPNRTQAADTPLVRANYAAFSGAFAPLWIAADRNLFAKYGLNVDIRYIAPQQRPRRSLARILRSSIPAAKSSRPA